MLRGKAMPSGHVPYSDAPGGGGAQAPLNVAGTPTPLVGLRGDEQEPALFGDLENVLDVIARCEAGHDELGLKPRITAERFPVRDSRSSTRSP